MELSYKRGNFARKRGRIVKVLMARKIMMIIVIIRLVVLSDCYCEGVKGTKEDQPVRHTSYMFRDKYLQFFIIIYA